MKSERFPHNARCTCPDPHGRGCDCRSCQLESVPDRQKRWMFGCKANKALIAALKEELQTGVPVIVNLTTGEIIRLTPDNLDEVTRFFEEEAREEARLSGDEYNVGIPADWADFEPNEPAGVDTPLEATTARDETRPTGQ